MAASDITALSSLSATPASGDLFVLVDISDTSMDANGTTKKVTAARIIDAVEANANTFTAAQIIDLSTDVIGLVIDTAAAPTADALRLDKNGAAMVRFDLDGQPFVQLLAYDNGTGLGATLALRENNNGSTPAAGNLRMYNLGGTSHYVWVDSSGNLRIGTTAPTNAQDTSGAVVGAQTSMAAAKQVAPGLSALDNVWDRIAAGAAAVRRFIYRDKSFNGQEFEGVVVDYAPEYGLDRNAEHPAGKSLNQIVILGDLLRATSDILDRLEALEANHGTNLD